MSCYESGLIINNNLIMLEQTMNAKMGEVLSGALLLVADQFLQNII